LDCDRSRDGWEKVQGSTSSLIVPWLSDHSAFRFIEIAQYQRWTALCSALYLESDYGCLDKFVASSDPVEIAKAISTSGKQECLFTSIRRIHRTGKAPIHRRFSSILRQRFQSEPVRNTLSRNHDAAAGTDAPQDSRSPDSFGHQLNARYHPPEFSSSPPTGHHPPSACVGRIANYQG